MGRTVATDSELAGDESLTLVRSAASLPTPRVQGIDLAAIYAEQFKFVWRCLGALGVPRHHLDDATQEVFLAAHAALASFRGEAAIRTWLYGILRNVAYKQRRSFARKERTEPIQSDPKAGDPSPDELAQMAEAATFVQHFAATLDDKKRDIFVLALLEGLSIPEVAEIVGVPLNTAYTRLRAVRLAFRAALEEVGA